MSKISNLYLTSLQDSKPTISNIYAQVLTADESVNPVVVSNLYAQYLYGTTEVPVSNVYAQVLADLHPYYWLAYDVVTPAYCWRIERKDGIVLGFTSHDVDLTFNGVTYEARTGFTPTSVDTTNELSVDNMDVDAALSSDRITEDDIAAGLYDYSKITVYLVNWHNLSDRKLILRRGTLGRVNYSKDAFTAEVRGLTEAFQQKSGALYQKLCRADFGDAKCKINLANYTYSGTVTRILNDSTFTTTATQTAGLFDFGILTWTSGDNNGAKCEVKSSAADGTIALYLPTSWKPAIGDAFSVSAGCDRNFSTCINKWGNWLNFRGEPYLPGNDYIGGYPVRGASNVVESGGNSRRGG